MGLLNHCREELGFASGHTGFHDLGTDWICFLVCYNYNDLMTLNFCKILIIMEEKYNVVHWRTWSLVRSSPDSAQVDKLQLTFSTARSVPRRHRAVGTVFQTKKTLLHNQMHVMSDDFVDHPWLTEDLDFGFEHSAIWPSRGLATFQVLFMSWVSIVIAKNHGNDITRGIVDLILQLHNSLEDARFPSEFLWEFALTNPPGARTIS